MATMAWRLILTALCAVPGSAWAGEANVCAGCHREIVSSYRQTGMGQSFGRATPANTPLSQRPYYHAPSESYFALVAKGGQLVQRRYQLDSSGREIHAMEKRVDYVLGSGNHARTYLHSTPQNTLLELPLGWYAEKGGYWAMNPGYDRPDHEGFRRPITYDCMFCHNAYPAVPARNLKAGEDAVYSSPLPEGIDCARCHGDATRHVALAGNPGTAPALIRQAIVNPARLGVERQAEICYSCHLETTSFPLPNALLRYERGPFSFRPGEPLANFILNFDHAPGQGREEKFEIVNSAYRMQQSACYRKSPGQLTCTTCHNPHQAPRGVEAARRYDAACRQCHPGTLSVASHPPEVTGCAACHMPKRRTEDVIHVAMTDHRIQRRPPPGNLLAELAERQDHYRGPVVPFYPRVLPRTAEGELYLAVAQVKQRSNLKAGIAQLTAAIARHSPARAEWYLELAEALENDGQAAKALPWYREAVRRDAASALAWQKLGTLLRRLGRDAEALPAFEKSLALSPSRALTWHELGLAYRSLQRPADAIAALEKALTHDAELPEAHSNLGILRLAAGDVPRAEASFREAIRLKPEYADAHRNLGNLLAAAGRSAEARTAFERALRLRPNDAGTHYSFAMLLGREQRYDEAQRELEAALQADPDLADARELLAELLMGRQRAAEAVPHYRELLRRQPSSLRAQLGLGASLALSGDRAGALPYLRQAAAGPDPGVREQALGLLRQLGVAP